MKRILIVGGSSAIAVACARVWAGEHAHLSLVGRDPDKLAQVAADLRVRGATQVSTHALDLLDYASHEKVVAACVHALAGVDIALIAFGSLSDQALCQHSAEAARKEFETNATSLISVVTHIAGHMEAAGDGTLAVISSVAGDRGRASNYVYGAAKAAVSTFCEGLGLRLQARGVRVLTIKPGPVRTPMTDGMSLPELITASPESVARDITAAIARGGRILYTPWYWRFIMAVVRALPSFLMARLSR